MTSQKAITMNTAEGPIHMRGFIASFVGDNLGSQAIGGFKEGGSALRPFRHCMVTRTEQSSKVHVANKCHNTNFITTLANYVDVKDLQLQSPN